MTNKLILASMACLAMLPSIGWTYPQLSSLSGTDLISGTKKTISLDLSSINNGNNPVKGSAVIFLSSICPCSNSHITELIDLQKEFPQVQFIGINSNLNESLDEASKYFQSKYLEFPVLRDEAWKIADLFKAKSTPHAFFINTKGEIIYRGGVSSSQIYTEKATPHLRNAIKEFLSGVTIRENFTRTLGCSIIRSTDE